MAPYNQQATQPEWRHTARRYRLTRPPRVQADWADRAVRVSLDAPVYPGARGWVMAQQALRGGGLLVTLRLVDPQRSAVGAPVTTIDLYDHELDLTLAPEAV